MNITFKGRFTLMSTDIEVNNCFSVAAVERLPALYYSVDFIFLSFGIIGFIVELRNY